MKIKNYLCRTPLQEDNTLAVVRRWSEPIVNPRFSIIDIASGLFVLRAISRKRLLELWEERKENLLPKIKDARKRDLYKTRCEELEAEKHLWREREVELE